MCLPLVDRDPRVSVPSPVEQPTSAVLQSQTAEPGSKIHYLQVTWHSNLLVSSTALARFSGHPPIMPILGLSKRVLLLSS